MLRISLVTILAVLLATSCAHKDKTEDESQPATVGTADASTTSESVSPLESALVALNKDVPKRVDEETVMLRAENRGGGLYLLYQIEKVSVSEINVEVMREPQRLALLKNYCAPPGLLQQVAPKTTYAYIDKDEKPVIDFTFTPSSCDAVAEQPPRAPPTPEEQAQSLAEIMPKNPVMAEFGLALNCHRHELIVKCGASPTGTKPDAEVKKGVTEIKGGLAGPMCSMENLRPLFMERGVSVEISFEKIMGKNDKPLLIDRATCSK